MLCSSISQSYLIICLLVSVFIDSLYCFLLGACAKPGKILNGTVVGSNYSYGSVIKFKCNKGYKLRGSAKLKCKRGVWESQFPECEGKFYVWCEWQWYYQYFNVNTFCNSVTEIDIRANENAVYSITWIGTLSGSVRFLKKSWACNLTCCMLYLHVCSNFYFIIH